VGEELTHKDVDLSATSSSLKGAPKEFAGLRASYLRMGKRARGEATLDEIESVYRSRLADFRRVAAAIVGDRELARDVVQEGFAHAVRQRTSFRGEGTIEAWLWSIVVNAARSQRRRQRSSEASSQVETTENGAPSEAEDAVRVAVSLLPERQRLVLFLRYYADLDYTAIATVLEISPGTVGATINAAHASLRPLVEEVRT
jgi:RNA polymerase sigma factor (sigma-70 family)